MTSPPAKRQRTEDASITRSKVWYKDGSVVLQAESTQFRVHWGVLSENSTFFRGLEDLPQPSDQPAVDGCPIVELPDAVIDVEYLLKALYDPTFLAQTEIPLKAVGALVRLGRKYEFKNLLDSAVARIMFENPTTLQDFDNALRTSRILDCPGFVSDLITLARENDIVSALPVGYHLLVAGCDVAEILDEVGGNEVDLRRCLIGRDRLLKKQFQPGYTLGWLRKWQYTGCISPTECRVTREAIFHSYLDSDYVRSLATFNGDYWNDLFCDVCCQHALESMTAGRKKMWEELPAIFDLPPWDQLKNDL